MVIFIDLIDVHNTIDTMKFSSFVDDYMYDDDFRDMNDDLYDYYDYQMSGALDDKYTGALSDDKAKSFNLEYYLDGLRSISGDGNFSMFVQDNYDDEIENSEFDFDV